MYQSKQPSRTKDTNAVPPQQQPRRSARKSAVSKSPSNQLRQQQIKQLDQRNSAPTWLKSLLAMQKVAMVLFGSVFGLSSIVYGYTLQTQDTWKSQQGLLMRWQHQERQQGVMNENLKQQMAQTAERPESGFVAPKPERMIFIRSAPLRLAKPLPAAKLAPLHQSSHIPQGY